MGQGLRLAMNAVEANLVQQGVNRIVMLGDGVPNDDHSIAGITAEATSRGISITTLGLGNDYDEMLMGRISQQTGGKFSYVEDSTKVASFFKEEVVRLHKVVAKNAVLELQPGPGVVVQSVIGRPTERVGRGMQVRLGDLTLGEQHELVVELASNPTKDGSTVEALDAVLRWQDGVGGESHEERVFVGAKATNDDARITAGKDEKVGEAVARAKDAAATLQKIEEQRTILRNERSSLDGAPEQAAPVAAQGGGIAPPNAMMKTPMPSAPAHNVPRMPADEMRRAHSQAIQNFQAN
jgi:Ca-activated chloride channel family protein